jgi:hypothetical protein
MQSRENGRGVGIGLTLQHEGHHSVGVQSVAHNRLNSGLVNRFMGQVDSPHNRTVHRVVSERAHGKVQGHKPAAFFGGHRVARPHDVELGVHTVRRNVWHGAHNR